MRELTLTEYSFYVLHTRKYLENSLICTLLTKEVGIVDVVAKGVLAGRKTRAKMLQAFQELTASVYGKGDLKTISKIESVAKHISLNAQKMIIGLYANELIIKLIPKYDEHKDIFNAYQFCLSNLEQKGGSLIWLRQFEYYLLKAAGFGIDKNLLEANKNYNFCPNAGVFATQADKFLIQGETLIKFLGIKEAQTEFSATQEKELKAFFKVKINAILGENSIQTRELLI